MSITEETRREAYIDSRDDAKTRRAVIYRKLLEGGPMTADTLMSAMGYRNPNNVRPRLTELKKAGLVKAVGKVKNRAGKSVALWEAIEKAALRGANTEDGDMGNNAMNNLPQEGGDVNERDSVSGG